VTRCIISDLFCTRNMLLRVLCLMNEQATYTLLSLKSGHDNLIPVSPKAQILQIGVLHTFW